MAFMSVTLTRSLRHPASKAMDMKKASSAPALELALVELVNYRQKRLWATARRRNATLMQRKSSCYRTLIGEPPQHALIASTRGLINIQLAMASFQYLHMTVSSSFPPLPFLKS